VGAGIRNLAFRRFINASTSKGKLSPLCIINKFMKTICISLALFFACGGYSQQLFSVHFDFNKDQLTTVARLQLDSFLTVQKDNRDSLTIHLNGYCDPSGSDDYNNRLSKKRVSTVKNYLLSQGIQPASIASETGHGEKIQLNENTTEEERLANRRVQISFSKFGPSQPTGTISLKDKIADSATKAGTNIVLRNINFFGGMRRFLPESTPMLEELLEAMRAYPKLIIRVEGHICCEQADDDGLDGETGQYNLSAARARAVTDYLVENNIAANRVSYKGFGHSTPLFPWPEKTEDERIQNRRVEIKIISK